MIPAGFLEALRDDPDDDVTRLVLADWFDDHGDPVRAEFIRLGVALPRMQAGHPERLALEVRYQALLNAHQQEWLGERPECLERWTFHGGLVGGLVFRPNAQLRDVEPLLRSHPVCHLRLAGSVHSTLPVSPLFRQIRTLEISHSNSPRRERTAPYDALLGSPHLAGVTALHLQGNRVDNYLARLITTSPIRDRLRSLHLRGSHLDDAAVVQLLRPGALPNLEDWHVHGGLVTTLALAHLFRGDNAPRWRSLTWPPLLRCRPQDLAGMRACVNLVELDVCVPPPEPFYPKPLGWLEGLRKLRRLTLSSENAAAVLPQLASWSGLARLEALTLILPGAGERQRIQARTMLMGFPRWSAAAKLEIRSQA